MTDLWLDQEKVKESLARFFEREKADVAAFGVTVNQTFEAFVFASVVSLYRGRGWKAELVHPKGASARTAVKLKFNTRGRPGAYTYALCHKGEVVVEVRHNLRVATRHHTAGTYPAANVCLDVAVITSHDLSTLKSNDHVENEKLVTFGEAKHMSAFAELVANFIGLVHEMMPQHLESKRPYIGPLPDREHLAPFLYVSGYLYPTAKGVLETVRQRGLDLDVYDHGAASTFGFALPTRPAPRRKWRVHRSQREARRSRPSQEEEPERLPTRILRHANLVAARSDWTITYS